MNTFVLFFITTVSAQWIPGSPSMPVKNYAMAVGYWNDKIYLIGGIPDGTTPVMIFDPLLQQFEDYFPSALSFDLRAFSNWYTQKGNLLFMSGDYDGNIHIFDLSNNQFTTKWAKAPINGQRFSCIAGDDDYLYYLGSGNTSTFSSNVQILTLNDLANPVWTIGPSMNQARGYFACSTSPNNRIYAIGGFTDSNYNALDTIEYISITNIEDNEWMLLNDKLTVTATQIDAVLDKHNIFAMGGVSGNPSYIYSDRVHIINTLTNAVTLMSERLLAPMFDPVPAVFNGVLYVFGGKLPQDIDTWQFKIIPTYAPTKNPTSQPTNDPTQDPTVDPTKDPTSQPTKLPNVDPTADPTEDPTSRPTNLPTVDPTQDPSAKPTSEPSDDPTFDPTQDPTHDPTGYSSLSPTKNPSPSPTNVKYASCGETAFIEYIESKSNGQLAVNIDYEGMVLFNATSANVQIDDIQVYNLQNIRIDQGEFDNECQCIKIYVAFKGRYQFIFVAETDAMIRIDVKCASANPTQLPTEAPTFADSSTNNSSQSNDFIIVIVVGVVVIFMLLTVVVVASRKQHKIEIDNVEAVEVPVAQINANVPMSEVSAISVLNGADELEGNETIEGDQKSHKQQQNDEGDDNMSNEIDEFEVSGDDDDDYVTNK